MAWKASPLSKNAGLMRAPPANRIAMRTSSPSSHPPTSWVGRRPDRKCAVPDIDPQKLIGSENHSTTREGAIPPAKRACAAIVTDSVFVTLADLLDRFFGHQLRPGVQI